MHGGKITSDSAVFHLCIEFKKLPSEIRNESYNDIETLIYLQQLINKKQAKQSKKIKSLNNGKY